MGRDDGATRVRIAKEIAQRRLGHESLAQRAWSLMLQYTIGFGYQPLRALWWIAGFVGLGAILFGWGYRMRIITPTEEAAYREFVASGEAPPHYPVFHPLVYSLENFLPVVELHQDKYWRPNPRHSRARPREARRRSAQKQAQSRAACCATTCGCTSWPDGQSRRCCSRACRDWCGLTGCFGRE